MHVKSILTCAILCCLGGMLLTGCIPILDKSYATPTDTSAANLDLHFVARVDSSTQWTAIATFTSNKTSIKFAKGETVSCEGIRLGYTAEDGTFEQHIPLKPRGSRYSCTYTSDGHETDWQITLPAPVIVTAPQPNESIDRKQVTIRYTSTDNATIQVSADNGEHTTIFSPNAPLQDSIGIYQFVASPPLPAGSGRLLIHSVRHEVLQGTAFHGGESIEDVGTTTIPVIWT